MTKVAMSRRNRNLYHNSTTICSTSKKPKIKNHQLILRKVPLALQVGSLKYRSMGMVKKQKEMAQAIQLSSEILLVKSLRVF